MERHVGLELHSEEGKELEDEAREGPCSTEVAASGCHLLVGQV